MEEHKEPTIGDVLDVLDTFSTKMDSEFAEVKNQLGKVENRLDRVENRLDRVENRLDRVEGTMVTKEYLDEKIADLRGDIIVQLRGEDRKFLTLVEVLHKRQVISDEDQKLIFSMKPFPQIL